MARCSACKLAAFATLAFTSAPVLCADPPPPPEVQQPFVFAGAWRGKVEITQPCQPSRSLDFAFGCKTVEAAWAVTCRSARASANRRDSAQNELQSGTRPARVGSASFHQ